MKLFSILLLLLLALSTSAQDRRMPYFHAKTISGENVGLEAVRGKTVLIQLWATWCGYCRKDEPIVEKLAEEFRAQGLTVIAANVKEPRAKVEAYLKEHPRKAVKLVASEDTDLPQMIQPRGFPFYVIVDKEGTIQGVQPGSGGEAGILDLLEQVGLKRKN